MSQNHSTSIDSWNALPSDRLLADYSLWSADLLRLAEELNRTEPFADLYHVDVSDGHSANALLFFPDLLARVRLATSKLLHVHLEVDSAILLSQIAQFAAAGADIVSIGVTSSKPLTRVALEQIHEHGKVAGLVAGSDTALEAAEPFLSQIRLLTLMGTPTGIKGQPLAANALERVERAHTRLRRRHLNRRIRIAADGGIRRATVPALRASGADIVVMGSLAFDSPDLRETMQWLFALPAPSRSTEI